MKPLRPPPAHSDGGDDAGLAPTRFAAGLLSRLPPSQPPTTRILGVEALSGLALNPLGCRRRLRIDVADAVALYFLK